MVEVARRSLLPCAFFQISAKLHAVGSLRPGPDRKNQIIEIDTRLLNAKKSLEPAYEMINAK